MSDKYTIIEESGITYINFKVTPTYEDIITILDILAENDIYEKRLYDLGDLKFDLSTDKLRSMAEYGRKIFRKPCKGALITSQDLSFGEGRQFSVYREDEKCDFAVFRNKEEAIDWLNL